MPIQPLPRQWRPFRPSTTAAPNHGGSCPFAIPMYHASITQLYNGARSDFLWTFGLTTAVDTPPNEARSCGRAAYVSQYDGGACMSLIATNRTATPTAGGCDCSFGVGESNMLRFASVRLICDRAAKTVRMNSDIVVTSSGSKLHYAFVGHYAGVCSALKKAAPADKAQVRLT